MTFFRMAQSMKVISPEVRRPAPAGLADGGQRDNNNAAEDVSPVVN